MFDKATETISLRLVPMLLVSFQAPLEDVGRILREVVKVTPLAMGPYDSNAFVSETGVERYRPLDGAAAGPEMDVRERPGVVEVSFELPEDARCVEAVLETIFQSHSYQEPVIRLRPILSGRSKGLDDRANPNRWWNTTGDWKEAGQAPERGMK